MTAFGTALARHLVESTLFAVIAGFIAVALQHNRAQTRYWVWFAASVKFLVPFSMLAALGSHLGWSFGPIRESSPFYWLLVTGTGSAETVTRAVSAPGQVTSGWSPDWLAAVWMAGFIAVGARCWIEWRRARVMVSAAHHPVGLDGRQSFERLRIVAGVRRPVKLLCTEAAIEPCVFGVWKPVLLLPAELPDQLTEPQFDAIVAHELAHIRRWDNLLASIHMGIQAVFWFHPMVWWLRVKLLNERERACDEAVIGQGTQPVDYAEGILRVCRMFVTAPNGHVAGVASMDLKRRIERIMTQGVGCRLNRVKKALLGFAALMTVGGPIAIGLLHAPRASAQLRDASGAALPKFDFATIRPSKPDTRISVNFAPGGRLTVTHATLRFLIKIAYDVGDDQIAGGPHWVNSTRFDLQAKPENPFGGDPEKLSEDRKLLFHEQVRLRLQSLLADRFQLRLRTESKETAIFRLVVGKNGPKLQSSAKASTSAGEQKLRFGNGHLIARGVSMPSLAHFLSEGQVGRPVVDDTNLDGEFDFELQWAPDQNTIAGPTDTAAPADAGGLVSIFTAIQQQLGLKLESRKSTADCFIIESAEPPAEN